MKRKSDRRYSSEDIRKYYGKKENSNNNTKEEEKKEEEIITPNPQDNIKNNNDFEINTEGVCVVYECIEMALDTREDEV